MREITINELKSLQLDILKEVHMFCTNNNIKYMLAYGTLLGAVRHKGYIPWDDDIDIMMPRKDYTKFLSLFNGYKDNLEVMAPEFDSNYYAPYANVYDKRTILVESHLSHRGFDVGVKIDVFPIDVVPDKQDEYVKIVNEIRRINKFLGVKRNYSHNYKFVMKIKHFLLLIISAPLSYRYLQNRIKKIVAKAALSEDSLYVDNLVYNIYPYKRFKRKWFEETIDLKFENEIFKGPCKYDDYLKCLYGDYMTLPPVEKQITHHNFEAYWK